VIINKIRYLLAACVLLPLCSANAATLEYTGDQVTAVLGLDVDGVLYDAMFVDGSYNDMLAAYPSPEYETYYTNDFAGTAMTALYDFTDAGGFAGLSPDDINGCTETVGCYLSTSVAQVSYYSYYMLFNTQGTSLPRYSDRFAAPDVDYTGITNVLWQPSAIPVPAAVWLFGSGLIGLIGVARRKKV